MCRRHLQAARSIDLDIVGICDPLPAALDETAREFELPSTACFSRPELLLRDTRPECVIIAATADSHCELTCLAAEAGARYILCEKPMACSLEECNRMLAACEASGARLAINHGIRFLDYYSTPKRLAQSEAFGGLTSLTVVGGNLGLAMNGTHFFEAFRYLTDQAPLEVTAWVSEERVPNPRGPQFMDHGGAIRVTTAGGQRFYLDIGPDQGHGLTMVYAGRYGQILVDILSGTVQVTTRQDSNRESPTTRYNLPADSSTIHLEPPDVVAAARAMLLALLDGNNYPGAVEGRMAVQVLVAAYVSHETGHRTVDLRTDPLPRERWFPWA